MGDPGKSSHCRVCVALLIGALLLIPTEGVRDASAARHERCSRANNPAKKIVYHTDSMTGVFVWDTKRCFPDAFVMGAWVSIWQITTEGKGTAAGWGKICKPNKPCRVKVSIEHPLVERSQYKFNVYDQATRGRRWTSDWLTCTSAAAFASCEI